MEFEHLKMQPTRHASLSFLLPCLRLMQFARHRILICTAISIGLVFATGNGTCDAQQAPTGSTGVADEQEKPNRWIVDESGIVMRAKTVIMVLPSGGLSREYHFFPNISKSAATFRLLQFEHLAKEVELVSEQNKQVELLLEKIDSANRRISTFARAKEDPDSLQEFQASQRELDSRIGELLLPHQQERLAQLDNRELLVQMGVRQYLEYANALGHLELSASDRSKLVLAANKIAQELASESKALIDDEFEKFLSILDESQRAKLISLGPRVRPEYPELYLAQCEATQGGDVKPDSLAFEWKFSSRWVFQPDGTIAFDESKLSSAFAVETFLHQAINIDELGLTAAQIVVLESLIDEIRDSSKEIESQLDENVISEDEAVEMLNSLGDDFDKRLSRVFLPFQKEAIFRLATIRAIHRRGIFAELLFGHLGQDFGLTKIQREKLESQMQASRIELHEQSRRIENDLFDELEECLPEERRKEFRDLFGNELKSAPGMVGFLAIALGKQ